MLDLPDPHDNMVARGARTFLAGLLGWIGSVPPSDDTIAGASIIDQGNAHIRTIHETGGSIVGNRPLAADGITPLRWVTHRGGGTVYLYEGLRRLRPATDAERCDMPLMSTWGYLFIVGRAAHTLGATATDDAAMPLRKP